MQHKNIFISIDGVDGVGKTTVAKILATDSSFQYHKSPDGPFAQLRKEIDAHATPVERYCFYRVAIQNDSNQIAQLLETVSVVCDRYVASTIAYHVALDARISTIHNSGGLLEPDFAFLLGAHSDVRNRRILKRKKIFSDRRLESNSELLDRIAGIFMSLGLIYIDTNHMTAEEVAMKIRSIIKQVQGDE